MGSDTSSVTLLDWIGGPACPQEMHGRQLRGRENRAPQNRPISPLHRRALAPIASAAPVAAAQQRSGTMAARLALAAVGPRCSVAVRQLGAPASAGMRLQRCALAQPRHTTTPPPFLRQELPPLPFCSDAARPVAPAGSVCGSSIGGRCAWEWGWQQAAERRQWRRQQQCRLACLHLPQQRVAAAQLGMMVNSCRSLLYLSACQVRCGLRAEASAAAQWRRQQRQQRRRSHEMVRVLGGKHAYVHLLTTCGTQFDSTELTC